jgi:outer membrane receptor protein involved in Fe transport
MSRIALNAENLFDKNYNPTADGDILSVAPRTVRLPLQTNFQARHPAQVQHKIAG